MTTTEKAFEISKLTFDRNFWIKELERCPTHEKFLRAYIVASLKAVTEDLKEATDA